MSRLALTQFSLRHPWLIFLIVAVVTIGFALQFPKVSFDNDPENMLSEEEPVRVFHHRVKEQFDLYDFVIVGIVNEVHEDGVFNVETLGKIDTLTRQLMTLHQTAEGHPAVRVPGTGRVLVPELQPRSLRKRLLARLFRHDVEDLFDADGNSVIIAGEVISPSVVDNIKQAERGQLKMEYLMESPPATRAEALTVRADAMANPLYRGTLVSEDGNALALYIPLLAKPYSYNVANLVEALTASWQGDEQVYMTGLPVAEDTFGVEMLVQMATSAPLAGLAIFLLLLLFFRRFSLILAPMLLAVVSVVGTMGLLIGLGFDVHIMSSMIAIFLMPIAVADSVHILSEFYDTYHRFRDKRETLLHVVSHLFSPDALHQSDDDCWLCIAWPDADPSRARVRAACRVRCRLGLVAHHDLYSRLRPAGGARPFSSAGLGTDRRGGEGAPWKTSRSIFRVVGLLLVPALEMDPRAYGVDGRAGRRWDFPDQRERQSREVVHKIASDSRGRPRAQ